MRGKWSGFAAVFLILGGLTADGQSSAEPVTQEQVRMFGSFYHDSIDTFFKVVGEEVLNMPMDEFKALPVERQRKACSPIFDHLTYHAVMHSGFHETHGKQKTT